jgi:preprotein translocase subunit Sec63
MAVQDYYAVLGVPTTCTKKEITTAFRKLSLQYHPGEYINLLQIPGRSSLNVELSLRRC